MNDPGKKSEVWMNIGYSQKIEDEPLRLGELLETNEPIMNSEKYLKVFENHFENIDEPLISVKGILKEEDIPKEKAGQPLRNTGETLKRLSKLIKNKNESWSVADDSTKLTEVLSKPGKQETDEPFKKKDPLKNVDESLYSGPNLVQKTWKSMKKAEELVKFADPSKWVTGQQKESPENNGSPLNNANKSVNRAAKPQKKVSRPLMKAEEFPKNATCTLEKEGKKIGSTDMLKEIESISTPRKPLNNSKEPMKKVPMLENNIREPFKKMKTPVSKYENPQKMEYKPLKEEEKRRKKTEELPKKEESPNKKRKYVTKVTVSLKKMQETESFERDVIEEPQSTEKSLEKEAASLGMSVQSPKKLEEPVKKETKVLMKTFKPLRKLRQPLKRVDAWNSEDILGDCSRTTPDFFRKTRNKIMKDECITKDRLVVKQSALCEKGEEEFELDKSSLKAYNLFCKCNPWKKSRKFQRKAHKLYLKVHEMEHGKCSELEVGKWEEIMLQHSKEKDALKKKFVELYKKISNAEKELEEILKQVFEKQTEEEMIRLAKEVSNEKALEVQNYIYKMFNKISRKDFVWTKELREELYCLEKWYSDLLICIYLLPLALKVWKFEIEKLQECLIKSQVRKLMVEKERSNAYRKMTYLSKEITKLKLRTYMALSPDKFQMEVHKLRKRAAYYDNIAKFFEKQQIILQSKVFNPANNQNVEKEDSVTHQSLFSWKKNNLSKNADQHKTADNPKNSSYQFKTLESWTVSSEKVVRHKNCKTSQMVWNIESINESAMFHKTWNYDQLKSWKVTTNALYAMSSALPKHLSSIPNGISVQSLKVSSTAKKMFLIDKKTGK
ncbi:uncharacterized protein [Panulirus ornatus]|uniref:uncharacterized protein n=1 Tax=Panulirus ornatus TaxID=150431 RepID=UPI003A858CA5